MKKYSICFIKMNNYNTFSKLVYCQFVYLKYYSVNCYLTGILQFAIDNPRRFNILLHYNCSERVILRYVCMSLLNHEYKFVLSSLSNFFFFENCSNILLLLLLLPTSLAFFSQSRFKRTRNKLEPSKYCHTKKNLIFIDKLLLLKCISLV